jgi:recombinational DNA repair protein (RecF pathway)
MSRVRLSWNEKPGRDLHQIDSMELLQSFADMQSGPELQAACALMAEITRTLVGENDPDDRFYRLLGAVLEAMRDGLGPFAAVRYFEFWTLRIHGMLPDLAHCGVCHESSAGRSIRLSSPDLGLRCADCLPDVGAQCRVPGGETWSFLVRAAGEPPVELSDTEKCCRPGGTLEWFLRSGLEAFAERGFKSYRHLRAVTSYGDEPAAKA